MAHGSTLNVWSPWLSPARMSSRGLSQLLCPRTCGRDLRVIFVLVLCIGSMIFLSNIYQLRELQKQCVCKTEEASAPVVWVHAKNQRTGFLKHVTNVFSRIGYVRGGGGNRWDVLWSHDYPFADRVLKPHLASLKQYQKVNHFPGGGHITNKISLAVSGLSFIPKSFKMPEDKPELLQYIKIHPEQKWVQKSNKHRGVHIKTAEELNLTNPTSFVQAYIGNPYLIDGRMFDIGIYTTLTSIDPLRVYVHDAEWLIRFCPHQYYPFDAQDTDKYVISEDYLPVWQVETLSKFYDVTGSGKMSVLTHLKRQGKDVEKLQRDLTSAIREVFLQKEKDLIEEAASYASKRNFFEMVRFDFILDENLNVYLLEVNMSPNLSSAHFRRNKLLYEQVVFSMLSLVGVARQGTDSYAQSNADEMNMQVSDMDISVSAEQCAYKSCERHLCKLQTCKLCRACLSPDDVDTFKLAYMEHTNRKTWRRVFPQPFPSQELATTSHQDNSSRYSLLNDKNKLMTMWFHAKCLQDASWCL